MGHKVLTYLSVIKFFFSEQFILNMQTLSIFSLVPDTVTVVIYNKTNKTLVLVKQLRAAVLFRESRKEFSIGNVKENVSIINESLKGKYFQFTEINWAMLLEEYIQ